MIRTLLRKEKAAFAGLIILLLFVAMAVFAPVLAPYGPRSEGTGTESVYQPPAPEHLLGTDDVGGDVLSEFIYGARVTLLVGFAATLISMLVGGVVGVLAGYFGGWLDTLLMRITDYFLVLPDLALMIVLAAVFGPSLQNVIIVIGLLRWTSTARVVRAQVRSVRERTYVKRARSLGAGDLYILRRHVVPQIATLLMANTVLTIAIAIFNETSLSFLGLGDPTQVSWGMMLHFAFAGAAVSAGAWWCVLPPGLGVILVVLACSLLGQSIEDALNPRLAVAHLSVKRFSLRESFDEPPLAEPAAPRARGS